MRRCILVIAILVAFLVMGGFSLRARADAMISFSPTVRETGVDSNNNGLIDQLVITFDLVVNVSGSHTVFFSAFSAQMAFASATVQEDFTVGTHPLTFVLPGPQINRYRLDGPYNVTAVADACGFGCSPAAVATYQTHPYTYRQFDPPYAYVSGPITDSGRDTNGDGYYDLLVVDIPVTVNQTLELAAPVYLSSASPNAGGQMTGGAARTYAAGTYTLEYTFDARAFYHYYVGGPFSISGTLFMVGIGTAEVIVHTTAAYRYTAFARPDADFAGPPTYETIDTNANGLADFLRIHVPLRVTAEGDYLLQSGLGYGWGTGANVYRAVHLTPGLTTIDLDYNGIALSRLGFNGPWDWDVTIERVGGPIYDANQTLEVTPAYNASDFESQPIASLHLSVNVTGCTANCVYDMVAYDPSNGFIGWLSLDRSGNLSLYDGVFEVLVTGVGGSVVRQVMLSGNGVLDVTMSPPPIEWINQSYVFVTLNESVVTTEYTTWGNAAYLRWWADLAGNHDGLANRSELLATAPFYGLWQIRPSATLDDQSYPLESEAMDGVIGAGPVTDAAPITVHDSADLRFPELPSPSFPKNITIPLQWGPPYYHAQYDFQLPVGTNAVASSTSGGLLTQVGPAEWVLTLAGVVACGGFPCWNMAFLEVKSAPIGTGGLGGDALLFVVLLVAVPAAVAGVLLFLALRRIPRRPPAQPPRAP